MNGYEICPQVSPDTFSRRLLLEDFDGDQQEFESFEKERIENLLSEKDCWHLCCFDGVGDSDHPGVREVAFRLNRVAVEKLSPKADGLAYEKYLDLAEREIEFLKTVHQEGLEDNCSRLVNCSFSNPTTNFGVESARGSIKSMGIRDDKDAQIIRNAIAVDCSAAAKRAFIMYRGANFQRDAVKCRSVEDTSYSLSFGSGLFAGVVYDGGATAFYYMRNEQNAYAIAVPFDQIHRSCFFIPPSNTWAQLFGRGEHFHGRTKAWKGSEQTEGVAGRINTPDYLRSELSKEELLDDFQQYKKQAIPLK